MTQNQGFNRLAIRALLPLGLNARLTNDDRIIEVDVIQPDRLAASGFRTERSGYGAPPYTFESDSFSPETGGLSEATKRRFVQADPSCAVADDCFRTLAARNAALADAVSSDSPSTKVRVAREATATALTTISAGYGRLQTIKGSLDTTERKLFTPPAAADAPEAILDSELRGDFKAMISARQIEILEALDRPENARILLALARYEFPWRFILRAELMIASGTEEPQPYGQQSITTAWNTKVAAEQPAAVQAYQIARACNTWAMGVAEWLSALIANPSLSGTNGALDRLEIYKIAKAAGGVGVLRSEPSQITLFEQQIAAEAARSAA